MLNQKYETRQSFNDNQFHEKIRFIPERDT